MKCVWGWGNATKDDGYRLDDTIMESTESTVLNLLGGSNSTVRVSIHNFTSDFFILYILNITLP